MFSKKKNIVVRKIHDTYFLINICQNYLEDNCYLYEINEVGYFIWEQLDNTSEIDEVVSNIMDCIVGDVNYSDIYEDVNEFINILINENFLEVVCLK